MDTKKGKKVIDPLPKSDDGFWKEAEKEVITLGQDKTCTKGGHYFVRQKQREAKCIRCPMGFYLGGLEELKEGHVYRDGLLLI